MTDFILRTHPISTKGPTLFQTGGQTGGQANLIAALWFLNSGRPIVARKPWVHFGGALYHVMSRGNHDQSILKDDGDGGAIWIVLKRAKSDFA